MATTTLAPVTGETPKPQNIFTASLDKKPEMGTTNTGTTGLFDNKSNIGLNPNPLGQTGGQGANILGNNPRQTPAMFSNPQPTNSNHLGGNPGQGLNQPNPNSTTQNPTEESELTRPRLRIG